ncbi:hypothetical protein JCM10212_006927 [Sporobolomyces blumeae]
MIGPLAARNARLLQLRGARQASTAQQATQQVKKTFWQIWYEPAALPIVAVVGTACFGAAWYLTRLARGPDVIWDRHGNPEPWNNVAPGTNTKMHAINKEFFTKEYSRDRL